MNRSNPNLPASQQFGAYKVGEFTHGAQSGQPGYKVLEQDGVPARQDANQNMLR